MGILQRGLALAALLISLSVFAGAPYISQWPNGDSPGPNRLTNANTMYTGLIYPTVNTNQFILYGLGTVPPSGSLAYLNGTMWTWNGHSYINGTNGIYFEPNYALVQPNWIMTNAAYHDTATPNVMLAVGGPQIPILPGTGISSAPYPSTYQFSDGTINGTPVPGYGNFLTNGITTNLALAYPPPFNLAGISNSLALITPEMYPYNAAGDGVTLDYLPVQRAINDCVNYGLAAFPVGLWLPHRYYMGTNALNLTPQAGNGGLRIYGNNAALQGVPNTGSGSANRNSGTLIWTNAAVGGMNIKGLVSTNPGTANNTATVIQGINLVGPTTFPGGSIPVTGTVGMDLSTPGAAQFILKESQWTFWDTCLIGSNCFDLTIQNVSANSANQEAIISGAQNLNINFWNAYPRTYGIKMTDNSTGTINGLDFSLPNNNNFAVWVAGGSALTIINANFDQGGCVYNDGSKCHVVSDRQGGATSSIRWVSTNCGSFQFDLCADLEPDPNNIEVAYYACGFTNMLVSTANNLSPNWATNAQNHSTNAYYWPGFR